jgi:hypothetical protein
VCGDSRGRARDHGDRGSRPGAARAGRASGHAAAAAADPHRKTGRVSVGRPIPARRPGNRGPHAAVSAVSHCEAAAARHAVEHPLQPPYRLRLDRAGRLEHGDRDAAGRHAQLHQAAAAQRPSQRLDHHAAVRARAQRRDHLQGLRHAVERGDPQPRRPDRPHRQPVCGPRVVQERDRGDPVLRAIRRGHGLTLHHQRRPPALRTDRPAHRRHQHAASRRRQPGALARADVPDAVHGGLPLDAEDLLRQRVVRAVGYGRVPRHLPSVQGPGTRRPQPYRPPLPA